MVTYPNTGNPIFDAKERFLTGQIVQQQDAICFPEVSMGNTAKSI